MHRQHRRNDRRGAMLVLLAVTLIVFVVCIVLSVDIAYMHLTRTELRTAVDAAARAGAESLSREQSVPLARQAAQNAARANRVGGLDFQLPAADIQFGRVSIGGQTFAPFVPNAAPANAVRIVSGRTDTNSDGPITLFFGRMLGQHQFQPVQAATAANLDRDIAIVLDISGSMVDDGKFAALSYALNAFLGELSATPQVEIVSLTTYATTSTRDVPLTANMSAISTAFASKIPDGWTAIGLGLQDGLASLAEDPARRAMAEPTVILMTDGIHNTDMDPETVAHTAPPDVRIHTITFGSDADQARMASVASIGRGRFFHAPSNAALVNVFREIAATLPVITTE